MARFPLSSFKVAFPIVKQGVWGTRLGNSDLSKYLVLDAPLKIDKVEEFYSDRDQVGKGHPWETARGILAKHVTFEIPVQPLPEDFIAVLVGLFFSVSTPTASAEGHTHTSKFVAVDTLAASFFTTFAIHVDGADLALVDVGCTNLTIRADGKNRLEAGGTFVATALETLTGYTWPEPATLYYLFNYSGVFEIDADLKSQYRGFELTMSNGINKELSWKKGATEAARIIPAEWTFTEDREVNLSVDIESEQGDLAAFESAKELGTEYAVEISCLGDFITVAEARSLLITVPKAVIDSIDQAYPAKLLQLGLKFLPHYDDTLEGPLSVAITDGAAVYLATEI